jgi:hypothetical protein
MSRINFQALCLLRTDKENAQLRKIGEQIKRRLTRIFAAEAAKKNCNHHSRRR